MKRRPSHRLYRRSVRRADLEKRIRDWAWKLRSVNLEAEVVTIGCHTITRAQLFNGKHIPGIPK